MSESDVAMWRVASLRTPSTAWASPSWAYGPLRYRRCGPVPDAVGDYPVGQLDGRVREEASAAVTS